jgi:putative endonuclease
VKQPVVYILADKPYGTVEGFTKKYGVHALVYFEVHDEIYEAIQREKRLKKWNRAWKVRLIEDMNPEWKDLYSQAF